MHDRTPERLRPYLDDGDPRRLHLAPRFLCALLRHPFRLHVRELRRLLELSLATSPGQCLELTPEVATEMAAAAEGRGPSPSAPPERSSTPPPGGEAESRPSAAELAQVVEATHGNVTQAAAQLGISRFALPRSPERSPAQVSAHLSAPPLT